MNKNRMPMEYSLEALEEWLLRFGDAQEDLNSYREGAYSVEAVFERLLGQHAMFLLEDAAVVAARFHQDTPAPVIGVTLDDTVYIQVEGKFFRIPLNGLEEVTPPEEEEDDDDDES